MKGSATTGSGAYSTCTASAPSTAAARVSANTAATSWYWKSTLPIASTICLSNPWKVGSQPSPAASRSLPVITALTPGTFMASLMSMLLISACGYVLRTSDR